MSIKEPLLPPAALQLIERFKQREASIGVIGLGYVGLPLAVVLGEAGYEIIGLDVDPAKVALLREGKNYIEDVDDEVVSRLVADGRLKATTEYVDLADVDGVSICVPTPLRQTGDPDLSFIVAVSKALREILHSGMLVILESMTLLSSSRQ